MPRQRKRKPLTAVQAQAWQRDPQTLRTAKVPWWTAAGSMMGLWPQAEAQMLVQEGLYFAISGTAIGQYDVEECNV